MLTSMSPSTPIKVLIPGLVGATMLAIEKATQHAFLQAKISESGHLNPFSNLSEDGSKWLFTLLFETTKSLKTTIFEAYDNYFAFMLMMLLLNVLFYVTGIIRGLLTKENKVISVSHWKSFLPDQESERGIFKPIIRPLLMYSLIFCFYQTIWLSIGGSFSWWSLLRPLTNSKSLKEQVTTMPSRILDEETSLSLISDQVDNVTKKPSLSIGKVLGQVDVFADSIKLSKDEKTAFVATNSPSTLKIFDVSDPESPVILGSLNLPLRSSDFIFKTLTVSEDETKIYTSNVRFLQIIDITNFKLPVLIATFEDKNALKLGDDERLLGYIKPNLLFSKDSQFLFVSGYGLQIFDISVSTAPVLIHSLRSRVYSRVLVPASIALSDNRKTLYYSDGGLWVFNVEHLQNISVLSSFNMTSPITSMILSNDARTAFVLLQNQKANILVQKLDISDMNSIKPSEVTINDQISNYYPVFIERTPNNLFMLIMFTDLSRNKRNLLLVFDTNGQRVLINTKSFLTDSKSVVFTQDYKKVFMGNGNKLEIAELYLDHPNKNAFTGFINTPVQKFTSDFKYFSLSRTNENTFYSLNESHRFGIHQINSTSPDAYQLVNISFYENKEEIVQLVISESSKRAFLVSKKKIVVADISENNITILGEYIQPALAQNSVPYLFLSRDGKTGFIMCCYVGRNHLDIIDFSDPQKITRKGSADVGDVHVTTVALLSNDERTVFILSSELFIYNVSDPARPEFITALSFLNGEFYILGFSLTGTLSPDGKTLVARSESIQFYSITVNIIDVSNVTSPQMRSEFRFPVTTTNPFTAEKHLFISADSKTLYIAGVYALMVIDISNVYSPRYLGSIKFLDDIGDDYAKDLCLSADGKKAYILTFKKKTFFTVALGPQYSTFLSQDTLMLGERYSIGLQVVKMDRYMDYNQLEPDFKFTKFALVEPKSIQNLHFQDVALKTPPSWMSVDLKSQTLTMEARRKSDIGIYRVFFGFSTQIPVFAFPSNGRSRPADIIATLLAQGYIDSQRFLTESFGEYEDFIMPVIYDSKSKQDIYDILKQFSFETFNEIRVMNSLSVGWGDEKFEISTVSQANVKVEISLAGGGEEAQFLYRYYGALMPIITNNKSRLMMEGSLKDINLALREVVINLNSVSGCDGEIIVDDKLNPIEDKFVSKISRYFEHNKRPGPNKDFAKTIQIQVDEEPVYTGQHFQIKLNQKAFSDDYTEVENLHYQLLYVKNNNETISLPSWLSFSDMTLTGIAPEEIWNRDFEFKLVVKNEFQEHKEPLKINVRISTTFLLKLLLKYSPYILSILAIIIKANQIFNVVCKGIYKHPKNFHVRIGEEVTSEVIFPISFMREEIEEAGRVIRLLEKKLRLKNKLLSYFIIDKEGRLDKVKIIETIKNSLNELTLQEKENFKVYLRGRGEEILHPRRMIDQIVMNSLTNSLLKSKEEKETRKCFEKIKKQWPMLVKWDLINSCFKINDGEFGVLLQKENLQESMLTNDNDDAEKSLLGETRINIDLLKDAILAYAFDCQNINRLPVRVQFHVKEKTNTNFVKRFLKLNLKKCPFKEKGKIGYGIGYVKKYNTVSFNGVVDSDLIEKTLIMQITNPQQRILKELWIYGQIKGSEGNGGNEGDLSKIEYKEGKGYEML